MTLRTSSGDPEGTRGSRPPFEPPFDWVALFFEVWPLWLIPLIILLGVLLFLGAGLGLLWYISETSGFGRGRPM